MKITKIALPIIALFSTTTYASNYDRTPEQIAKHCKTYINTFNKQLTNLTTIKSRPTYNNVMEPLDDYLVEFADQLLHDNLMKNVHPKKEIREASTECTLQGFAIFNGLAMNRPLYDKISLVNTSHLSPTKQHTVNYWRKQFEASGIGKDAETRKKIKALNDEISEVSNKFSQNITDDIRSIRVKPERLKGVPQDYIDSHPAGEDGLVTITTSYSDIGPIFKYAHDNTLRKELYLQFNNRAYPTNQTELTDILNKRFKLAQMLNHDNFAQLDMVGTMVETPEKAQAFASKLNNAIITPVKKEKARLLARLQKTEANATKVNAWDASYISNLIRQEDYQLDAKEVREYFDYDKVRDGIVTLAEDLFTIEIKPRKQQSWHTSVESFDVYENNKHIGIFHFDSHPREGKYTHAAQFGLKMGKKDVNVPEAALLMNFPKGLMEHGQVETFLHEFGHLIHYIFAGQNEIGFSRFQDEPDFGEAPSMMLEEWVWDYDTLKAFATNKDGEVIPKKLVKKMNKARYFGQAIGTARQLTFTAFALDLYNQDPKNINLNKFEQDIYKKYSPYELSTDVHPYASFGHLTGYGAKYYTYQWSNSIAEELLSRFKKEGLRNPKTANDYRHKILAVTGTRPASELVKDFLGRDFSVDAYAKKLSKTE